MTETTTLAVTYIGLGSNLQHPIQQLEKAFVALSSIPNSQLLKKSSLYLSEPMGQQDQDHYVNAVAKLTTKLTPIELLDHLQIIENSQGRLRTSERWAARTLDLDLLLYGNQVINNDRLIVPHYGIKQRSFVILPLAEIEPHLYLPDNTSVVELTQQLGSQGIQRL